MMDDSPRTTRPLAVVVGFIGKAPVAGMALYNLHYIVGLEELGYNVHYVERVNRADECYDPATDDFGDDSSFAVSWVQSCLAMTSVGVDRWSFIRRDGSYAGAGREALLKAIRRADFVLTLADPTWFDELAECPRRAFLDGDPVFTQAAMLDPENPMATVTRMHPTLFTYATRLGAPDCLVPAAGREWIATRPVVSTSLWDVTRGSESGPVTTVMNLGAWSDVRVGGHVFGHKRVELEKLIELPARSGRRLVLALGGPGSKEPIANRGWEIVNPLEVTGTIDAYRAFITGSHADLGIAKHAYVASRSGWFSDRSTCYLASGRPVLHQQTGFTDWLPEGKGVLAFSNMDDLLDAFKRLDADYQTHAKAARAVAEEHFEARKIVGRMLDDAGFR